MQQEGPPTRVLAREAPEPHDRSVQASRSTVPALLALALSTFALAGCSKPAPSELADRLWISEMPGSPRDSIDAFMLTEIKGHAFGTFYQGSLYRGTHDSFKWSNTGKDRADLELLQDGRIRPIAIRSCKPDEGFDLCVRLEGDPKGVVRYQSKKRWTIPRRKSESLDVGMAMLELAEDDAQLEALVDARY